MAPPDAEGEETEMSDYKYEAQVLAEEMAEADGRVYHDLDLAEQGRYYGMALQRWAEDVMAWADALRERD